MNVAALYKTFSGGEWACASLDSIYDHVNTIVMVHSDISWTGKKGNNVKAAIKGYPDPEKKIRHVDASLSDQQEQYDAGMAVLRSLGGYDWIFLVDVDEIYPTGQIDRLYNAVQIDGGRHLTYRINMFTFIKDVHYMVWPPEPCQPVVLVRKDVPRILGIRGNAIPSSMAVPTVKMHHYTLVRDNEEEIAEKVIASNIADNQQCVNIDKWMENVWKNVPNVRNFHYTVGYENCWAGIRVVDDSMIPEVVKKRRAS